MLQEFHAFSLTGSAAPLKGQAHAPGLGLLGPDLEKKVLLLTDGVPTHGDPDAAQDTGSPVSSLNLAVSD